MHIIMNDNNDSVKFDNNFLHSCRAKYTVRAEFALSVTVMIVNGIKNTGAVEWKTLLIVADVAIDVVQRSF